MSRLLAISQRVTDVAAYTERRDALDQRWCALLEQAGFLPLLLPNRPQLALALIQQVQPDGLIFTGGNSLQVCGGDAPERDETEHGLLSYAMTRQLPVFGVCRGMQLILSRFGQSLVEVSGHVCAQQTIRIGETPASVNSYHTWGCYEAPESFAIEARSDDGVVKAIRHHSLPIAGVMWHPERLAPFREADINLLQTLFA